MKKIVLYGREDCLLGKRIASLLEGAKIRFEQRDLNSPQAAAWLSDRGVSASRSPVLVMDDHPLRFLDSDHLDSMPDKNLLAMVR